MIARPIVVLCAAAALAGCCNQQQAAALRQNAASLRAVAGTLDNATISSINQCATQPAMCNAAVASVKSQTPQLRDIADALDKTANQ